MTANQPCPQHAPSFKVSHHHLLDIVAIAACLPTLIGFLGRLWWGFELFCHFRVQYFIVLTIIALGLVICRRFKAALITGVIALINLALILPLYISAPPTIKGSDSLRLLSMNVLTRNTAHDKVRAFIRETDPDFVLLQEINSNWMRALEPMASIYPYQKYQTREDNFGIALLSKLPFSQASIEQSEETGEVPYIVADLKTNGKPFTLIVLHTLPPVSKHCARGRDGMLSRLATFASDQQTPLLIGGDFNTTSWSPGFRTLLRTSGLRDSRKGFGVQATWPSNSAILRIPIDHCLVSSDVKILNRHVGTNVDSDHLPIVVDFVVGAAE